MEAVDHSKSAYSKSGFPKYEPWLCETQLLQLTMKDHDPFLTILRIKLTAYSVISLIALTGMIGGFALRSLAIPYVHDAIGVIIAAITFIVCIKAGISLATRLEARLAVRAKLIEPL